MLIPKELGPEKNSQHHSRSVYLGIIFILFYALLGKVYLRVVFNLVFTL